MNDEMSAYGTKRTCAGAPYMSAFGGKADIDFASQNVAYMGLADNRRVVVCRFLLAARSQNARL